MASVPAVDLNKAAGVTKTFDGPGVLTGRSAAKWAQLRTANRSKDAPHPDGSMGGGFTPAQSSTAHTETPYGGPGFKGLDDSCNAAALGVRIPTFGLAVASSSSLITEVVNDCIAVYSPTGVLQPGFPKSLQNFFGVPAPAGPAGCAADFNNHPWLDSPRAFYDFNANRFWVADLQTEGALNVSRTCTEVSRIWLAVSATSDPLGAWHVYNIGMLGVLFPTPDPTAAANFLQFAFGPDGVYWSVNMFDQTGATFEADAYYGTGKARFEAGLLIHLTFFQGSSVGGLLLDTLQPAMNEAPAYGPRGEFFVSTFNINGDLFGRNCITQVCQWAVVTMMSNAGPWGDDANCPGSGCAHTEPITSGTILMNIRNYFAPGAASQPACKSCVSIGDTRISATPIYAHGQIYAAISTGLINTHDASFDNSILWTEIHPTTSEQDPQCTFKGDICPDITAASQEMGWYFYFNGGDTSAYYPALMSDEEGNLCMVYGQSSSTEFRSAYYTCRRDSFQSGLFRDPGRLLQGGTVNVSSSLWGPYFAASYDGQGPGLDHPTFCGQYTGFFAGNNDWGTWCARVNFQLKYG
jgi:hypothetical protein